MPTNVYLVEGAKDLSAGASYSPAALPINGDSLFIQSGSQAIDTGLAALTSVNLATFFQSAGFKGSAGLAGSPVELGNVTSMEIAGGGGQHYYDCGTVTALRVSGTAGGKVWFAAGTYTTAVVFQGEVEFNGDCTVTKLVVLGGKVILRKLASGAASTQIIVKGGEVVNERNVATLEVVRAAGTVTNLYSAAVTTRLRVMDGRLNHKSDGTIAYLEGIGGVFSTTGADRKFSVTNGELWDGFSLDDTSNLTYLNWTNQPLLYGYRGGAALKV